MDLGKNIPKIFLDKVKWIDGCPIWQGSLNLGLPHLVVKGVHLTVIWEVFDRFHGTISDRKTHRLECTCDKPLCIHPEHRIVVAKKMTDEQYRLFLIEKMLKNSTLLDNGCRIWNGTKDVKGYGQVKSRKDTRYTHCLWYELNHPNRTEEEKLLQILHNCRNTSCFIHSRQGTGVENADDKIQDGTLMAGSKHYKTSINEETVKQIYALAKKPYGKYAAEVAKQFKTTKSVVLKIWDHVNWCHVTRPEKVLENKQKRRVKDAKNKTRIATKEDYEEAIERLTKTCTKNDEGCMISSLYKDPKGYTMMSFFGSQRPAHVIVAEFYHNKCKRIENGLEVGHSCKNQCVAKGHVRICTHSQNMQDNYTDEQKEFVRKALESQGSGTIKKRAEKLGVSVNVLSEFDRGITFSSLSGIKRKEKNSDSSGKLLKRKLLESKDEEWKEEEEVDKKDEIVAVTAKKRKT